MSNSLWPHGLYSPWNSPGQNTRVNSLSLLQGIFPTQGSNSGLLYCRKILHQLSHKGSPRILAWVPIPSPADLSNPGIKLGPPALQADSLPAELSEKSKKGPTNWRKILPKKSSHFCKSSRAHNSFPNLEIQQKDWAPSRKKTFGGHNKTLCAPGPRRKEQRPRERLSQTCLCVSGSL